MSIEWDVNYIAVVVADVAGMVIGAVYVHAGGGRKRLDEGYRQDPGRLYRRQPTSFVRAGGCIHPADGDFVGCCESYCQKLVTVVFRRRVRSAFLRP